ncbi:Glycosyltransferase [Hyella patelloides LEGE 07179]|uniref:Glycosyltransferase n=1 Tax=Hyella patelloides LEGE 07179 TaxID=945734 RepID=A0A563VLF6_9CYAN|nr:glycosyltransferase family 4 protein [Hyella patelloides]VEP12248.1 Glycosyltransferase [Hyella patelloides LEGE 07179]
MRTDKSEWLCFQLGSREHYSIPRVLNEQKILSHFITDTWIIPNSPLNLLPHKFCTSLRERFHHELATASISSFNNNLFWFEIQQKIRRKSGWNKIISRNQLFQEQCLNFLRKLEYKYFQDITIFSYSYTALEIFRWAKKRGWRTILGQIDPGIYEEKIVKQECYKYPQYSNNWQPAPSQYWKNWQQECDLADTIVVNSQWSEQALQKVGISQDKIKVIPLAYAPAKAASEFVRTYPKSFNSKRPLKVLFLGQIILRKGIAQIVQAIELLAKESIEFWLVGSVGVNLPNHITNNGRVKLFGKVSRSQTAHYYQQADIFLFPTLSDGFGLTQLEAQAWGLPIIASKFCGEVVKDEVNGLILPELTGESIAKSLQRCLHNPEILNIFAGKSLSRVTDFDLSELKIKIQHIT